MAEPPPKLLIWGLVIVAGSLVIGEIGHSQRIQQSAAQAAYVPPPPPPSARTLTCGDGYDYLENVREQVVELPPKHCWTNWQVTPGFPREVRVVPTGELVFQPVVSGAKGDAQKISPVQEAHFGNVTGIRLRNDSSQAVSATIIFP